MAMSSPRRDVLAAGILTLVLLALLLPAASLGVDAHHDACMLKPALDVLSGQVLFRDSFMQYGAMSCYLQALALWIQPTLLSIRLLTVVAYALTLLALYAAWRLILPRSLAVIAGLFFILFIPIYEKDYWDHQYWLLLPWSSVYAMLFQCLGVYALFRVIRGGRPETWGLVLGAATACVFWCRQPVGVMMLGSLVVIAPALHWAGWQPAALTKRAIAGRVIAGLLLVHAVMFGGMAATGALPAWWYQNFIWPAKWSQSVDWMDTLPFSIHPVAAAVMGGLVFAMAVPVVVRRIRPGWSGWFLPAYGCAVGALVIWQREEVLNALAVSEGGWVLVIPLVITAQAGLSIRQMFAGSTAGQSDEYFMISALAAVALGSLFQYYPMADSWHIFYSLAPTFGLFVAALWRWSGWPAPLVAAGFAVLLLPAGYYRVSSMGPALNRPLLTLEQPAVLRGMKVPPEQIVTLTEVDATLKLILHYRPDVPSVLIGDSALYLCLTKNLANPTPYYVTWRGLASQADNVQRWAYIADVRPIMILQNARWHAADEFYRRSRYVPLIYVPRETLEIAVPQELADRMGLKAYELFGTGRPNAQL